MAKAFFSTLSPAPNNAQDSKNQQAKVGRTSIRCIESGHGTQQMQQAKLALQSSAGKTTAQGSRLIPTASPDPCASQRPSQSFYATRLSERTIPCLVNTRCSPRDVPPWGREAEHRSRLRTVCMLHTRLSPKAPVSVSVSVSLQDRWDKPGRHPGSLARHAQASRAPSPFHAPSPPALLART
jgi:hypothetical protein